MADDRAVRSRLWLIGRMVVVIPLGLVVLSIACANLYMIARGYSSLGLGPISANFVVPVIAADSPAAGFGLRTGDRIDLKDVPLEDRVKLLSRTGSLSIIAEGRPGEQVHFTVTRDGLRVPIVATFSDEPRGFFYGTLIKRIIAIISVALAATLVLLRPNRMLWAFYFFTLGMIAPSPFVFDLLPVTAQVVLTDVYNALLPVVFLCAGLLVFVSRFPDQHMLGWRRWLDRAALPIGLIVALITISEDLLWQNAIPHSDLLGRLGAAIPSVILALGLVVLIARFTELHHIDRQKLKWVVAAFSIVLVTRAYALVVPAYFAQSTGGWGWPQAWGRAGWDVTVLLTVQVLIPLALGYAVLKHRVLDVNFVLRRSLVYGVLVGMLAGIFALIDWLFTQKLAASRFEFAVDLAAALCAGVAVQATHGRLIVLFDRFLFRRRYDSATRLDGIRRSIQDAASIADLDGMLTAGVADVLGLTSAAVFKRVEDGGFVRDVGVGWEDDAPWHVLPSEPMARRLENERRPVDLHDVRWTRGDQSSRSPQAEAVFPIRIGRRVGAITMYGGHASGASLDPDEIGALKRLAAEAGNAYGFVELETAQRPQMSPA